MAKEGLAGINAHFRAMEHIPGGPVSGAPLLYTAMPGQDCVLPSGRAVWTRRHFLRAALGGAVLGPLSGCSDLGLDEEEPLFDGPKIDENDFIAFNAGYYDVGVDAATQFPYSSIRDGVPVMETDPVAIAFRLQHLLADLRRAPAINTMLTHLLAAQISERPPRNFRNMIPRLKFTANGTEPATHEYSFVRNALLSSRVAMTAQAFRGTAIADKAATYLQNQKLGYNQALSQSSSGFLPTFAHAGVFGVDLQGMDLLFGGYYEAVAFVLAFFIGETQPIADPQAGLDSWKAMISAQNTFSDVHASSTTGPIPIQSLLARNGSAFQYFHSLLALEPEVVGPSLSNALYNALFSYLDAAVYDRVPGVYSAGPHAGGFLLDNGLNRLAARQRLQGSQESIVTIDALAAAMRLFPESSDERLTLRGWIGLYASVGGVISPHGYFSGISKKGEIITAIYARQNGAMILFKSTAAALLNTFLETNGRPGMRELFSQVELTHEGAPIQRVQARLPLPPRLERLFTAQ